MALMYQCLVDNKYCTGTAYLHFSPPNVSGSIIVPMQLGQPVGSVDPLLVNIRHGWAGNIKNIVTLCYADGLTADKTKLTKSFTWIWIFVVGSYN